MEAEQCVEQGPLVIDLPYHHYIRSLHTHFPHLEALSLYLEECEKSRASAQLGSHDSNSILLAEVANSGNTTIHRIDCYDHNDLDHYRDVFTGHGDTSVIRSRILVLEDLAPATIELLGSSFN
ncbi:hypothetical protein J3459_002535 [Metarhizium acridum]|nr:hypothetical protein J3459_002535 [Metarhizium acridum]